VVSYTHDGYLPWVAGRGFGEEATLKSGREVKRKAEVCPESNTNQSEHRMRRLPEFMEAGLIYSVVFVVSLLGGRLVFGALIPDKPETPSTVALEALKEPLQPLYPMGIQMEGEPLIVDESMGFIGRYLIRRFAEEEDTSITWHYKGETR
jgi:hypothetical protein